MPQLFISYRRSDKPTIVRRLYECLAERYSPRRVFRDIDGLAGGLSFNDQLRAAIRDSNVVLVVIGRHWSTITADDGTRRLSNPDDYVRQEVEQALKASIRVVPVLLDNTIMPSAPDVPSTLQPLLLLHALPLRSRRFEEDIARLTRHLDPDMTAPRRVSLYNGRDLTGWQLVGPHTTTVESRENVLICQNTSDQVGYVDHLLTTRRDFTNFELSYEFLVEKAATPAIAQMRVDPSLITFGGMRGYALSVCGSDVTVQQQPTSSQSHRWDSALTALTLMSRARHGFGLMEASYQALALNEWHRVEIQVLDNRVRAWINRSVSISGPRRITRPTIDYSDDARTFMDGAIAFAFYPGCRLQYRNISVRQLPGRRSRVTAESRYRWTHRAMIGNEWNERWQAFQYVRGSEWIESITDVEGFWQHPFSEVDRTAAFVELQRESGPNVRIVVRLFADHAEIGPSRDQLTDVREGLWM